ncbi:uncharacterized protein LOC123721309 [Papilio machaon]|uniref:uncharacterized protein LOC123721309 n=1 Tax=Papilio machaon TaxID=76193 RepID=UPI001E665B53|nr:uncharacterized protein LOC123721309 [Papilio machaon]
MEVQIKPVPETMLKIIPIFEGDNRHLNLYIRKCEYVIERYRGNDEQNLYVYHVVTSRLSGNAAALLSERDDIVTWSQLKDLLEQHFGDPRSEECINIELESLKINPGETYLSFCNRIQTVRSNLISKVNTHTNQELKTAKIAIYNNTALNVFLYNLPENMVRIVRLKSPSTLEAALSVVLEEVNFHDQYTLRNKMYGSSSKPAQHSNHLMPLHPPIGLRYKPNLQQMPSRTQQIFGNSVNQNSGFRLPQPGFRPPIKGFSNHPQGQQFGYRPQLQQFGYRPQLQQFGYRPQLQQFGYRPQLTQQFGYKPPIGQTSFNKSMPPQQFQTDVSMRTAPLNNNAFKVNELTESDYVDEDYYYDPNYYEQQQYNTDNYDEYPIENDTDESMNDPNQVNTDQNHPFEKQASLPNNT